MQCRKWYNEKKKTMIDRSETVTSTPKLKKTYTDVRVPYRRNRAKFSKPRERERGLRRK